MYASYFGLREPPFAITPDPRYLYLGDRHREALAGLLYGSGEGGGFVQLTGEVGTGKTTLCRGLIEQLPTEVDVALVLNPAVTPIELVATVCDELKVSYPPGTTSVKLLVDALHRHLLDAHARDCRTVLVVDEAQSLTFEVLEQIRLLTNLETETTKLLQVILIGQPELVALLDRPRLRQVAQRITARYHLLPLSLTDTRAYIRHRLEVARLAEARRKDERIFTDAAERQIHRLSGGVPRLINVICDRALLGAYALDQYRVGALVARRAAIEVLGRTGEARRRRIARGTAVAAVLVAGALAVGAILTSPGRVAWLVDSLGPGAGRPPATTVTVVPPRPRETPPAVAAPTATRLARLLEGPGVGADRGPAFARLYAHWGVEPPAVGEPLDCRQARLVGLGCLVRTGTWTRLRRFDLPAVIELAAPAGDRRYAAVTALGARSATLQIGGHTLTAPLADIDPFWDGAFTVLWKPPATILALILPGAHGPDVQWLRRRLAAIDGKPAEGPDRSFYDDALKERVVAFQRRRSLSPDGVVGEETLVHLTAAVPEPGLPRLSSAGGD
jgi:general secretion pathway protein A